ncbi:hypothetical protein ACGFNV_36035 [Streptomyces sp. NPDC048751]|uniref:hypothetical protein n=1 Tax=Streptomyces sp. NPDC048751 TaxID=3365591 RepID=UPI00371B7DA9
MAWANDRKRLCFGCRGWRQLHPDVSACERCQRHLPLKQGKCRFCTLLLKETEFDVSGISLAGGDQLWFGREFALRRSDRYFSGSPEGRLKVKRRRFRQDTLARRPTSPHVIDPSQLELFPTPPRDWSRLRPDDEYALTPMARALYGDFTDYLRDQGVDPRYAGTGSLRTLRVLTAHLGAAAPIDEVDVKAIATLSDHHNGRRVICFLRQRGILRAEPARDAYLLRARKVAASLPAPFDQAVHIWIDVLLGQGSRSNPSLASATIYSYVHNVHPTLKTWAESGITDLREITKDDVQTAITDLAPARRHSVHPPLRSLFEHYAAKEGSSEIPRGAFRCPLR